MGRLTRIIHIPPDYRILAVQDRSIVSEESERLTLPPYSSVFLIAR